MTDKPDPALFVPGTNGCHEALHMAHVLTTMVEDHLWTHPAITQRPEWHALAGKAVNALADLYQAIGREH